ncbi:MAG: ABC transporter ATP-binding protein [Burkholderiales bacterium]
MTEQAITYQAVTKRNEDRLAIGITGLNKRFAATAALQDVAVQLAPGALFGLVGANGAGKTTLIKCLLDLCAYDSGRIEIFGVPSALTAARRRLAFLPERFIPPYYLTGEDFLRFMLRMYGRHYESEDAHAMLDALDLAREALVKPVRAFSKGMTQKLGLAACLMSGRELLVLDEPTSGLDPQARALLKAQLKRLHEAGSTLFLTSHSLADVEELCDEMAVLHQGRVRFVGTPCGLKERHAAASLEQAYLACIA